MQSQYCTIVIVSWNTKALLRECLASLRAEVGGQPGWFVVVVDNNSADGSADMVTEEFPEARLIVNTNNVGFGKANNQVLSQVDTEYVLLLNPDTVVLPGTLNLLKDFMRQHPRAGIVAPQLLNTDGTVQRSCRAFPAIASMFYELVGLSRLFPRNKTFRRYKMLDFDHTTTRQVDQPEGACLLMRSRMLHEIGLFDERFFMLFEEVDLCYRAKQAGWEIWFYSAAKIIHHYGQSIKQVKVPMILSSHKGMYLYWSKHHRQWYHIVSRLLLGSMLILLAGLRITLFYLKKHI